jgi:hypothetical protein
MFTAKELYQVNTNYFNILKTYDDFIEIQSINTKHYWIIKKQITYTRTPLVLYHKHSLLTPYYHKQSRANSINHAIQQIKSHDKYVLKNVLENK